MSIWVHIISKNLDDNFNYGLEQTGTRFFQWTDFFSGPLFGITYAQNIGPAEW